MSCTHLPSAAHSRSHPLEDTRSPVSRPVRGQTLPAQSPTGLPGTWEDCTLGLEVCRGQWTGPGTTQGRPSGGTTVGSSVRCVGRDGVWECGPVCASDTRPSERRTSQEGSPEPVPHGTRRGTWDRCTWCRGDPVRNTSPKIGGDLTRYLVLDPQPSETRSQVRILGRKFTSHSYNVPTQLNTYLFNSLIT